MLSIKATVLLGAPLLAAASEVIPSRIQRRAALLELLEHQHDRRQSESYGQPDICKPDAGQNDASYISLAAGGRFADNAYAFVYQSSDASCVTENNCQSACIADASTCFGYTFDGAAPVCTLYGGSAYGGAAITTVPEGFMLLQNAGTSEEGAPTCATKGNLDTVDPSSGACTCGVGRHFGANAFVCEPNTVSPGAITPAKPLDKPVTFSTPVSWSNSFQAVPAVMTASQCSAVCLADAACQAYLLKSDSELNSCWKLGNGGIYPSPANDAPTASGSSTRMAKRQAAGTQLGGPGFTFGETPNSTLVNDADAPAPSQRARMMRTKRGHNHSQW